MQADPSTGKDDFYIHYVPSDSTLDFVESFLCNYFKDHDFKGSTSNDVLPGENIIDEVFKRINNSNFCLVIFDECFLTDNLANTLNQVFIMLEAFLRTFYPGGRTT